jgi:hypothetical protein
LRSGVPALVLLAAFAMGPAVAKEPRVHHSAKTEKSSKANANAGKTNAGNADTGPGANAKSKSPDNTETDNKIDAGVTVLTPRAGNATDKAHNPNIIVKIAKPVNLQVHSLGVSEPVKPVVRNSIGEVISHPQNVTAGDQHVGVVAPKPVTPSIGAAGSDFNRLRPHPVTTASNFTGNKSGLIRPSSAPAIGGPAKSTGGINGTAVRSKY